jgi:DNA-binding SARP family transcriptional activator/Tfp pilus assembly protein PilF
VEFRILGPIELIDDGRRVDLRTTKVRGLLGILLLAPNIAIASDTLANRLWDEPAAGTEIPAKGRDLPPNPVKTLQTYVTRLRDALNKAGAPARLTTEHQSYCLRVAADLIDYHQFQRLAMLGRNAARRGDADSATETLTRAVALWHGPPLADLTTSWARHHREALIARELLPAYYDLLDAQLSVGNHETALKQLRPLLTAHDTDESLAALWMRAVAAVDGPNKLPGFFRAFAERCRTSIGAEPSDQLRQLYERLTARGGRTAAGAPAPTAGVPRQLPRPSPYFVGRQDVLDTLDTLVPSPDGSQPIVAIDGTAGVGKTETVIQWGHARRASFPDGTLYVNLNGYGPGRSVEESTVLTTFLDALGVSAEHLPRNAQDRAALLRHTLAGRRVLIVLDNALDSDHVRPLLAATGSCPVIVTSRQQLTGLVHRDGARRITLGKLSLSASIALLARRIGAARTSRDQAAFDDLAVLCDGLPLGLRVAAEHIAASPEAPVRSLVDGFRRQRRRLLDTGSFGDDGSTTLRAVFSCSLDDLQPVAARTYRLLGLHPSTSFSTSALVALAGISRAEAERVLDVLIGAHLVDRQDDDGFRLHDLLFLFATELAAAEPPQVRDTALRRIFDWYLGSVINAARRLDPHRVEVPPLTPTTDVTPESFDQEEDALRWCISQRFNIVAASRAAAESGYHDHAWRLIGEFDDVLIRYGSPRELLEVHHLALASARRPGVHSGRLGEAGLVNNLGFFYAHLDDHPQAATCFRQAQKIYLGLGDVYGHAVALMNVATTYMERGRFPAAINLYEHALESFEEVGNTVGLAHAYHRLGDTYARMAEYDRAASYYQRALRLREGMPRGQADTLTALGELQLALGDNTAAIGYCEAALGFHHRALDTRRTAKALETLAAAHHQKHHYADAVRYGEEAREQYQAISDLRGQARTLTILGRAREASDDRRAAEHYWRQAEELFTEVDAPEKNVIAHYLGNAGAH